MTQQIYCAVSNCHYWSEGNACAATEIIVVSDAFSDMQPASLDAKQARSIPRTPVQTCMETCCKTFVDRGSCNANADSVRKIVPGIGNSALEQGPIH